MASQPLVSILIPVYNREAMIVQCLRSALAQTYSNIEIVVGDNASTDGTFQVVQDHARQDDRIRCFRNDLNVGAVRNWLKCLEHSTGEYIKLLFSDDWLEPQAVERLLVPILENPEVGFAYSTAEIHDETTGTTLMDFRQEHGGLMDSFEFLRGLLTGSPAVPVSPVCAIFRRRDVERGLKLEIPNRLGLDCAQIGFGPDLLLYLHACDQYPKAYYEASVLSHFRGHEGSITVADRARLAGLCYDVAFSWFLATSELSPARKRYFNAVLFIRTLDPTRLKAANLRNPYQVYKRMFPDGYNPLSMNPLSRDAAALLLRKLAGLGRLLRKRLGKTG